MEDELKFLIKENSVVQINENGNDGWVGCLVQVQEVKSWGIQGWVSIPKGGNAYVRLNWNQFEFIGSAVMLPEKQG